MKKVLFTLVALIATMSINAQTVKKATVMKVLDGETVLETHNVKSTIKVVFEKVAITGTEKRNNNIDVNWVQLWENGPKFAVYNVGAADNKAEDYGGYYCWGSSIDKDPNAEFNEGTSVLTGNDDTATNLWGNNWRMPTIAELQALLANCDVEWTDNYKESGIKGRIFTGKEEPYKSNSIFLPAAGDFMNNEFDGQGSQGDYWSSTPAESAGWARDLDFDSDSQRTDTEGNRKSGRSVRAVLK